MNPIEIAADAERALWELSTAATKAWHAARLVREQVSREFFADGDDRLAGQLVVEAVSSLMEIGREGVSTLDLVDHVVREHLGNAGALAEWQAFVRDARRADALWNPEEDEAEDPEARGCEAYHRHKDDMLTGDAA
ncbi:MAG: hypothetical protein VW405_13280 [Rhodospirillaceae bacterium]